MPREARAQHNHAFQADEPRTDCPACAIIRPLAMRRDFFGLVRYGDPYNMLGPRADPDPCAVGAQVRSTEDPYSVLSQPAVQPSVERAPITPSGGHHDPQAPRRPVDAPLPGMHRCVPPHPPPDVARPEAVRGMSASLGDAARAIAANERLQAFGHRVADALAKIADAQGQRPRGPRVGETWRPWGMDCLATVIAADRASVTIRYDHDDTRTWVFTRAEFYERGRVVHRPDYQWRRRHTQGELDAELDALLAEEAAA